jgi:hypothetical protein
MSIDTDLLLYAYRRFLMPPKSNPGVRTLEFEPQGSNTSSFAGSNPEVRGSRFEKKTGFGRSPTRALRIWSQMLRDSTRTAALSRSVRGCGRGVRTPGFEPKGSNPRVRTDRLSPVRTPGFEHIVFRRFEPGGSRFEVRKEDRFRTQADQSSSNLVSDAARLN